MRKLSLILSKMAISADDSDILGKIVGVLVDKSLKSVDYFVVDTQIGQLSNTGYFAPRSIKFINDETVLLSKKLCIKNADEIDVFKYFYLPHDLPCFDMDGNRLGVLKDILFGDTTKSIESIKIDNAFFAPYVLSLSQDALVLSTTNGIKKRKPKLKIEKTENTLVKALDDENDDEKEDNDDDEDKNENTNNDEEDENCDIDEDDDDETEDDDDNEDNNEDDDNTSNDNSNNNDNDEDTNNDEDDTDDNNNDDNNDDTDGDNNSENNDNTDGDNNSDEENNDNDNDDIPYPSPVDISTLCDSKNVYMPQRIVSNYRFLLGRVVTKNIYNYHHQLIIKFGQLVTADVVKIAHENNKLIELTLCSKS